MPTISLGEQHSAAISSISRMEHRLLRDSSNASDFHADYENLGHFKISREELSNLSNSTTSRIMPSYVTAIKSLAYESSSARRIGMSLNDHVLIGFNLETSKYLATVIKWRQNRYAFTTYIGKMYQQILVWTSILPGHWLSRCGDFSQLNPSRGFMRTVSFDVCRSHIAAADNLKSSFKISLNFAFDCTIITG